MKCILGNRDNPIGSMREKWPSSSHFFPNKSHHEWQIWNNFEEEENKSVLMSQLQICLSRWKQLCTQGSNFGNFTNLKTLETKCLKLNIIKIITWWLLWLHQPNLFNKVICTIILEFLGNSSFKVGLLNFHFRASSTFQFRCFNTLTCLYTMSSNAPYIYDFTDDNQSPLASTLDRQLFSIC